MKKNKIEMMVGYFLILGFAALAYLSINLGNVSFLSNNRYSVFAEFDKIGGLQTGVSVEIAGVEVGDVESISLNRKTYRAILKLRIDPTVELQEDSIASIKTKGLLGERYVEISPGASDTIIKDGGEIMETESAIDLGEIIAKYAFGDM